MSSNTTVSFPLGKEITKNAEITGELWKYGNVIAGGTGWKVGFSVYFALCDDRPWWCPCWLMEKIKKRIVKIHVRDMKVHVEDEGGGGL